MMSSISCAARWASSASATWERWIRSPRDCWCSWWGGAAVPDLEFRATVSGGTYLRSLARDIGAALGCGAHLSALRRTAVGPFRLEEAVAPEAVTPAAVRDASILVADLPRRNVNRTERDAVVHGRPLARTSGGAQGRVALFADDELLGVAECVGEVLKPRVVVAEE